MTKSFFHGLVKSSSTENVIVKKNHLFRFIICSFRGVGSGSGQNFRIPNTGYRITKFSEAFSKRLWGRKKFSMLVQDFLPIDTHFGMTRKLRLSGAWQHCFQVFNVFWKEGRLWEKKNIS
jgi:hypothetical protein